MTTPKRDIRRFRMVSLSPVVIEPNNRRLAFDGQSFRGPTPSAPVLADHVNATGRVAGRVLSAWADRRTGSILGDIEIYPDNIEAAAHVRRLLAAGHRGASINFDADRRQPNLDGTTGIFDWAIAHLAIVGQGADPTAGPVELSTDGTSAMFNLEILAQEDDMTTPNPFDLNAALPLLTSAIAEGVKQGNAATDTGGPAPAEQMSKMLAIAISQPELYAKGAVAELALDAAMGLITSPMDFRAKLESIQIISRPQASGLSDAEVSQYDLNAVVQGIMANDMSGMSKELSLSNEIRRGSDVVSRLSPDAIAIPLNELASHSGTTGDGASGTAIQELTDAFYDSGTPDSTDILPFLTELPSGPGIIKPVAITAPQPGHVVEPLDAGYGKTGDATGVGSEMRPHLLVDYMSLTRVLQVLEPEYEGAVLEVVLRRFMEQQNRAIIAGDTTDSPLPDGLYGLADVGSSGNLNSAISVANVEAGLSASVHAASAQSGRAIVTTPENVQTLRSLAQPAAVSALMSPTPAMNGEDRVRDARVFTTNFFPTAKTRRGITGPFSDILLKNWDGAVYVSRRYEGGINWLLTELFWDVKVRHPALFYRFRED